jgi:hypothetical protein
MNWRRGLLLAGINLLVAIIMILMMEAEDQKHALTNEEIMADTASEAVLKPPEPPEPEPSQASPEQAEEAVVFSPCGMWVRYPTRVVVVQGANLLPITLAGWEDACPPHWTLAWRLRGNRTWPPTPSWMGMQRKIDAGLCLFIAIQWFLMGGFPLVRTRKWWIDPGSFITACTVLAGGIALIPVIDDLARLPASIATLAWLWWFGLLAWKTLQFGWRLTTGRLVPRSS